MLPTEVAGAAHLDEAFFVAGTVVEHVQGVALECVLNAVPRVFLEGTARRTYNGFHGDVECHGRRRLGNVGYRNVCVRSRIRFTIRLRCRIEGGVV